MSSDSEDDCYSNIALKLKPIKDTYIENKIKTNEVLNIDLTVPTFVKPISAPNNIAQTDTVLSLNESDDEEISLDAIIAQNETRKSKNKADISSDNILPARNRRKRSNISTRSSNNDVTNNEDLTLDIGLSPRARGRQKRGRIAKNTSNENEAGLSTEVDVSIGTRRRGGRRGRARSRGRARGRRRGITQWGRQSQRFVSDFLPFLDFLNYHPTNSRTDTEDDNEPEYPTYSVGNTDEYPDECYNQELFSNKPTDTVIVEENELADDSININEELSVKVYWRSSEYHKFNIRRYQKLTQIFKFFAEKENVSEDRLLFIYNDKILKIDDTPDSITYNIAKFIDGGIVNQSLPKIVRKDKSNVKKSGLAIKFQCQNEKRPFETTIQPEEKMSIAMMLCAEHFEKPLDKMKFYFDGDLVSGKSTPKDLELEGGECIDVKIVS